MEIPGRFLEHSHYLFQRLNELYGDGNSELVQAQIGICYFSLAANHYEENPNTSIGWYESSIEIFRKLLISNPSNTDYQYYLAKSYFQLGFVYKEKSHKPSTYSYFQQSLEMLEPLILIDPQNITLLHLAAVSKGCIVYAATEFSVSFEYCLEAKKLFHDLIMLTNEQEEDYVYCFCICCFDIGFMSFSIKDDKDLKKGGLEYYTNIGIENLEYCLYMLNWVTSSRALTARELELYKKADDLLRNNKV